MTTSDSTSIGQSPRHFALAVATCCAALLLNAATSLAGPETLSSSSVDPTSRDTFNRGQAVAAEPGLGIAVFPIPLSNPTIGTGLGLGAGLLYHMDEESQPSYSGVGALATSNRTWGVGAVQYFSLDSDRYRVFLGLGYASVHYDFFGAGSNAGDRGASIPIRQNGYFTNPWAEVRVFDDFYVGLQYRLLHASTEIDAADVGGRVGKLLDRLQLDFVSSGFGPMLDWDTRDDPFWPTGGHLLHADAVFANGSFFSDFTYQKGHISYNYFREVFDDGILALRASGCFTGGDTPVVDLCLFGANNDLRGYQTGRYRDENFAALQAEQRWKFAKRWGLVGFAGVGGIGSSFADVLDSDPLASGGLGLRFQVSESYKINLALDSVVNLDGEASIYFRIGEAF